MIQIFISKKHLLRKEQKYVIQVDASFTVQKNEHIIEVYTWFIFLETINSYGKPDSIYDLKYIGVI